MTTSWNEFAAAAPTTAKIFSARLAATGMGLLATLRSDGFPRISPLEPGILGGKLYLGMMPNSTKSLDLRRDPRCCLHSATEDKNVENGDAKLWGRGVEVVDEAHRARWAADLLEATGMDVTAMGDFDLWLLDITGGSSIRPEGGDHLEIAIWKEGELERSIDKY
jgi:hypothetical protein